jgi:hypothetical protein
MSKLDRFFQRSLLMAMRDIYPREMHRVPSELDQDDDKFYFNLMYLQEHRLCEANTSMSTDGFISWGGAKITAAGIDFLEDDGGLSEILGVVTVKLEADTLRRLIEAKIDEAELPAEEKTKWKGIVRGLSETALRTATSDLVQSGLHHIPNITEMLRGLL